jgi:hypothetical protein
VRATLGVKPRRSQGAGSARGPRRRTTAVPDAPRVPTTSS